MISSYKVALGVAGLAVIGGVLTPQFGFGQERNVIGHEGSLDKIVTKHFENVNVNEVFAWLVEQGFSYVIKDADFSDTRVSMNIDHQTLWDAANSLADVLGGHWTREGNVYVFRKDGGFLRSNSSGPWASLDSVKPLELANNAEGQAQIWTNRLDQLSKDQKDQSNPLMMVIPDGGQMTPEQKKAMEDWGKLFGDSMKNFKLDMPRMEWTPEQRDKFQKQMEEMGKQFGDMKNFKLDMPKMEWTPQQKEEFKTQMDQMGKHLGDMKNFKLDMPKMEWTPEQKEEFKKQMDQMGKHLGDMKNFKLDMPKMDWTSGQQKDLQLQLKGLGDQMKDFKFVLPDHEMTPEQQKQFEEQMKDWSERFQDKFKDGKWFSPNGAQQKDWEEFGKRMEKWSEEFTKSMGKDGNVKVLPPLPPLPPARPDAPKSEIPDVGEVD